MIKGQKSFSIYLAIMIMTILLALAFGISTILLSQVKMVGEMGDSVIAFYAADTGIEKVLDNREDPSPLNGYSETLANGASYQIFVLSSGPDCPADNFCIKSVGTYKGVRRAIEISY